MSSAVTQRQSTAVVRLSLLTAVHVAIFATVFAATFGSARRRTSHRQPKPCNGLQTTNRAVHALHRSQASGPLSFPPQVAWRYGWRGEEGIWRRREGVRGEAQRPTRFQRRRMLALNMNRTMPYYQSPPFTHRADHTSSGVNQLHHTTAHLIYLSSWRGGEMAEAPP